MKDPTERRTLLAIVLCLAVFYVWSALFGPKPELPVEGEAPVAAEGAPAVIPVPVPVAAASEAPCVERSASLATGTVALQVSTCGGGIDGIHLPGWQEPVHVTPWWHYLWELVTFSDPGPWRAYAGGEGTQSLLGPEGEYAWAGSGAYADTAAHVLTEVDGGVTLSRTTADGLSITQSFAKGDAPDLFALTVTWSSDHVVTGPFWVGVADRFPDMAGSYDMNPHLEAVVEGDLEQLLNPTGVTAATLLPGPVSWFGVADRYFLAALAPEDPASGSLQWAPTTDGRMGGFFVSSVATVSPDAPLIQRFLVYIGPKHVERMNEVGRGLDEAANLGFFGFFSKILLFFLNIFHAGLRNWGLSIIALTFLVRLTFYPLSAKAFRSAKMMQAVQPRLKALQERYKDDKEAQTRETMALFSKHGVNPIGGCLPMLLQMPVFFALYSALLATPDLYHAQFLYVRDLSAPDPWGLFPAAMAVGMVLQQRMTPMTGVDPAQQQMMRWMPLIFALFMFSLPAGLSLYYALNTLLSILQQWYNTRSWQPIALAED